MIRSRKFDGRKVILTAMAIVALGVVAWVSWP